MLFDTQIGPCGIALGRSWRYCRAAPRGDEAKNPRPAASAMSARARSNAAGRRAGRDRRHRFALERGGARSLRNRARHGWFAVFDRRVYEVARTIAPGATLSYGEISARLGARDLAREVGQALGRNPFPIIVPCHRVLAAGGEGGRLLRQWRDHDEAAPAHDRTRAYERYAHVVRRRQRVRLCAAAPAPQLELRPATRADTGCQPRPDHPYRWGQGPSEAPLWPRPMADGFARWRTCREAWQSRAAAFAGK